MRPGQFQMSSPNDNNGGNSQSSAGGPSNRMSSKLSQILSQAGGVKMNADLSRVTISRDGVPFRTVNLWQMLASGDSQDDVMLQSGDSVYIPELQDHALNDEQYTLLLTSAIGPKTFPVRIIGEVGQPGVYELDGRSPFLNSAIAKSGGFRESANRKVIALRRFSGPNHFTTMFIDPNAHDFTLRPNDVVFISELKVYKAGRFAETVSRVLAPFSNAATTAMGFSILRGAF